MESDSDSGEEFDIEHSETDSTCSALSSSSDNETDSMAMSIVQNQKKNCTGLEDCKFSHRFILS